MKTGKNKPIFTEDETFPFNPIYKNNYAANSIKEILDFLISIFYLLTYL